MPGQLDFSLYPQPPQATNPLDTVNKLIGIRQGLIENQLQQQNLNARQAIGPIVSRNTDQNGNLNSANFLHDVSQNPDTARLYLEQQQGVASANPLTEYMGANDQGIPTPKKAPLFSVPGGYNTSNALMPQANGQNPNTSQLDQDTANGMYSHIEKMKSLITPLADNPNVTMRDVMKTVADIGSDPDVKFSHMDGASFLAQLPTDLSAAQINQMAKLQLSQLDQNEQALSQRYPSSNQKQAQKTAAGFSNVGTPGATTGVPAGYAENQHARQQHYQDVLDAANSVPTENAALDNVLDISKSGAPTGTVVGEFYKYLAQRGIAPDGAQTAAEQLALIQSHASQLALAAGMPGSDARLHALETAKIGSGDLPKVIQSMIPYLKAVNNAKVAQAKYYRNQDPTGLDPNKIANAQSAWQQTVDPRAFELQELRSDPQQLAEFTKGLSKQDRQNLLAKYSKLKEAGVLE